MQVPGGFFEISNFDRSGCGGCGVWGGRVILFIILGGKVVMPLDPLDLRDLCYSESMFLVLEQKKISWKGDDDW